MLMLDACLSLLFGNGKSSCVCDMEVSVKWEDGKNSQTPFIQTREIIHFPIDSFGSTLGSHENIYIPFSAETNHSGDTATPLNALYKLLLDERLFVATIYCIISC